MFGAVHRSASRTWPWRVETDGKRPACCRTMRVKRNDIQAQRVTHRCDSATDTTEAWGTVKQVVPHDVTFWCTTAELQLC